MFSSVPDQKRRDELILQCSSSSRSVQLGGVEERLEGSS
jgi:hypothetical protein